MSESKTSIEAFRVYELSAIAVDATSGETMLAFNREDGDRLVLTFPRATAMAIYRGLAASPIGAAVDNPAKENGRSVADKYIGRDGGPPQVRP